MTTISVMAVASVAFIFGVVTGRFTMLDSIDYLELAAKDARRFAGKLGDRIGRQRMENRRLKAQLKILANYHPGNNGKAC